MKRGVIFSGVALVAVAAAGVAAAGFGGDRADGTEEPSSGPAATTQVTRQTLVQATTVEGELSYGDPVPLESHAQGTVTWLPAVGATVGRGKVLFRADERPAVLLRAHLDRHEHDQLLSPATAGCYAGPTPTAGCGDPPPTATRARTSCRSSPACAWRVGSGRSSCVATSPFPRTAHRTQRCRFPRCSEFGITGKA